MNVVSEFHKLFYQQRAFKKCRWMGMPIWKNPLDLWIYQEIIYNFMPDIIVETGSYKGASAHYFRSMMKLVEYSGEVISIDIVRREFPSMPGLEFLTGSSIDYSIVEYVKRRCHNKTVMVVLDSDHSKDHVLKELNIYSEIVTPHQYLIVEDTNLNGHPVITKGFDGNTPGPMEALVEFMRTNNDFRIDHVCEKLLLTMHPKGFLLKKKND